jgi:hypothetical protein
MSRFERFTHAARGGARPRKTLIVAVAALLLVGLNAASADADASAVTVNVGATATLTDRLLVAVPVTVVCAPLPNTPVGDLVFVEVTQAAGQNVSRGSGRIGGMSPEIFLICDGSTPNNVVVSVLPDVGSGPFHGGAAIVTAFAQHDTAEVCDFFPGCFFNRQSESGTSGPVRVKLRG